MLIGQLTPQNNISQKAIVRLGRALRFDKKEINNCIEESKK